PARWLRSVGRSEALPVARLIAISHIVAALTTSSLVGSRIAASNGCAIKRGCSSAHSKMCVSSSSRTDLLKVLLQLRRQRPVEIIGNVGDSEEVLPKPALFSGRLIRNQLGFRLARLGDDDLFAGGSAVDQL